MTISTTLSGAQVFVGAAGAVSDGNANATLVVTVRDTANLPVPHCQVHVEALGSVQSMIVTHVHNHPTDPARRITYTDANGAAIIRLGSVSSATVDVQYLVYVGEDTPDTILYATTPALLAGRFGKPNGATGYVVGTLGGFTTTHTTAQSIDDAWFTANNAGSREVVNRVFAAGATLAFTVDPNNEVRFTNCVFASPGNYSLATGGKTFRANNCGFRASTLAALFGPGGTIVRSVFDTIGRDAVQMEEGSTFTPSTFVQCRFRNLSMATAGYAFRGTPMRNVLVEHCWFELATSTNLLGIVSNVTTVGGSRGPFLSGCWIEGGTEAQVSVLTGASTSVPTQFQSIACRYDLGGAETYIEYDGVTVPGHVAGNMDDTTGRLIDSDDYPAANTTAGPVDMWPQVTLATMPSLEWIGSAPPGGGGGGGPGAPGEPGSLASIETDLLYSVTELLAEPVGGGPGGVVVRPTPVTGPVMPAVPIPVPEGGGGTPNQPATVNWDQAASRVAEGSVRVITARLTPAAGQGLDPLGYSVGVVATYTSSSPGDFVSVPAVVVFGPGQSIGQFAVQAFDDAAPEGDEVLTLTLQQVTGLDEFGATIIVVQPGSQAAHAMTVLESDTAPPGPVDVYFGVTAVTVPELTLVLPQNQTHAQIPISLSGNPIGQVQVSIAVTGTASGINDYVLNSGTVYTFNPTGNGTTPPDQIVDITIIADDDFEADETIILTLTSVIAATATVIGGPCTITIEDDDIDPGLPPEVGWLGSTQMTLLEANGNAIVPLGTGLAGSVFSAFTFLRVQCISGTATFPDDCDLRLFNGTLPTFEAGSTIAEVPISAGQNNTSVQLRPSNDLAVEGEEFLTFVILPRPGVYTVIPNQDVLTVRILDPLTGGTDVFVERIPAAAQSLVSCTVPAGAVVSSSGIPHPSTGWNMALSTGSAPATNCQWYPVSYRPDGTPDSVHIWGLVEGAEASVPGAANAVRVSGSNPAVPTAPITLATQRAAVLANNLRLQLQHDVNGEARLFEMQIAAHLTPEPLIDRTVPSLQGGGPSLFARYRYKGQLRATTGSTTNVSDDKCTVARTYIDFRADMNAVAVTVNWGNYCWHKYPNATTDQHKVANPYVDGEVFFKHLHLEGVPDGWAAVMADPRTAVTAFRADLGAGNNRVEIIKAIGSDFRHYLPPLRGHIAYIVLYETATVTSAQATAVLNGYDRGYCVGPLGIDRNDVLGELGHPVCNYGVPYNGVTFRDVDPSGSPISDGWAGSQAFTQRELVNSGGIQAAVIAGESDLFYGEVERGWWLPFADSAGGAPGGNRIDISGGCYPGKFKRRKNQLELVHLWHRMGMVPWNEKGETITDEDFCIEDATGKPRVATAMWTGIGGQRMAHQHFYVPDFFGGTTSGVPTAAKLGPGRKRATGSITLAHPMQDGDTCTIVDGSAGGATWVFTFTTTNPVPADAGTTTYVLIGADAAATNEAFFRAVIAKVASSTFRIHLRYASDGTTFRVMHRFHGTPGNSSMTGSARVTVVGLAGGLSTNATAGVRLWNYLVPGTNRCTQDVFNDWHARHVEEGTLLSDFSDQPYHCFDWPHMSRMNEVTRDGWWLFFDPAAHDCIVGLGHLGTMCMSRFPEARGDASVWIGTGSGTEAQLATATGYSSLALIREAHAGRYLRHYTGRNLNDNYTSVFGPNFTARVTASDGINCGTWITRNPQIAAGSFNPATIGADQFIRVGGWPIDRGFGWLVAHVARMYAVDACHRTTATKDDGRLLLHPAGSLTFTPTALKPSWFEMVREVIQLTMHRSGAQSSEDDIDGIVGRYTDHGSPNFTTRTGSVPGGPHNIPTVGISSPLDEEWYAIAIAWQCNYICMGAFAVMKRVYSWIDKLTEPSTSPSVNPWGVDLLPMWKFGALLLRSAKAVQGGQLFFVPSFPPVGTGDRNLTGIATSTGVYGRFNEAVSAGANPETIANAASLFWWAYAYPVPTNFGGAPQNYYFREYLMWAWMYWRINRLLANQMVNDMSGLIGQGEGTIAARAPSMASSLMSSWNTERNGTGENVGDEIAWVLSWLRNDFIP